MLRAARAATRRSTPCLLDGIVQPGDPRSADTFRGFVFHINLETLPQPAARLHRRPTARVRRDQRGPTARRCPTRRQPDAPDADDCPTSTTASTARPARRTASGVAAVGIRPRQRLTPGTAAGDGAHRLADRARRSASRADQVPDLADAAVRPAGARDGGERAMSILDKQTTGDAGQADHLHRGHHAGDRRAGRY